MFNSEKIMNWVYWGTPEEQNKKAWAREVKRAKDFLEQGRYSPEEFAQKVVLLRRKYGISKYKHNPILGDFNENL